jgi:hypothetical protein
VSYLKPLYGTVGDPIRAPLESTTTIFFGHLVQHLGFSLHFPEVALVAKNRLYDLSYLKAYLKLCKNLLGKPNLLEVFAQFEVRFEVQYRGKI